jgi:hypothetical protein
VLKLSSDVSETFVVTLNGEVADADTGEIADEAARLAAEMFLNTSVIFFFVKFTFLELLWYYFSLQRNKNTCYLQTFLVFDLICHSIPVGVHLCTYLSPTLGF